MTPTPQDVRRNRGMLLLIVALFFGSMLLAGILRFSGWRPAGTKNFGELLSPPGDLRTLTPRLADGRAYAWEPSERRWRIAVAPPAECANACARIAQQIDVVWQLMGKDADHVDVLWLCADATCDVPAPLARESSLRRVQADAAFRAGLPRSAVDTGTLAHGLPVYVIDPNGFVILRYAPGFDPAGLRADLAKLTKLM
jgi:cytochrome oxidase Cu insertion factor (SCO1/SenC/PrrC family)